MVFTRRSLAARRIHPATTQLQTSLSSCSRRLATIPRPMMLSSLSQPMSTPTSTRDKARSTESITSGDSNLHVRRRPVAVSDSAYVCRYCNYSTCTCYCISSSIIILDESLCMLLLESKHTLAFLWSSVMFIRIDYVRY